MPKHSRVYSSAGKASTPSIHRQASSPPTRAMSALDRKATRMPKTMLNWNIPASRPRQAGGAISAMYIGAATVEMPTPSPPMNRATLNEYTSVASADHTAETKYSAPIHSNVARRPKRSAGQPPSSDPSTVPYNAAPIASPCNPALKPQSC